MKVQKQKTVKLRIVPADSGFWLEAMLEDRIMKYLWKCIDEAKKMSIDHKTALAGNISESYLLPDIDGTFTNDVIQPVVNEYITVNKNEHPHKLCFTPQTGLVDRDKSGLKLSVHDLWVNFQNKHEFNPPHRHDGMYSFVIWMKIPYSYEEECKLPFLEGVKQRDLKPGCFEISYTGMLGDIRSSTYHMSPKMEGHMLLFPAGLTHQVFPFYSSDEQRVTISGNVWTVYE